MKKNVGKLDRIIRLALAVLVAVLYFTNVISGTLALVLGIIAVILLVTSLIGTCPLYMLLGISTKENN